MKWKLVDYQNREVAFNTVVTTLIGSQFLLVSGEPPPSPLSSGKITVRIGERDATFFPHVFNFKWIQQ